MRLALLGGTGDIGEGLALRWARDTDHEVLVGSRDPDRARDRVEEYKEILAEDGAEGTIKGFENGMAADRADVVVLSVPPYHVESTVESVADRIGDAILVSPAVGIKRDDEGFHYHRPPAGSVTALAAEAAPDDVPVVGAFHSLPASRLSDLGDDLGFDTLVVGDDRDANREIAALADEIDGLRVFEAGPLANAAEVESLTPLLINLARFNRELDHVGVRFD
ncbi:NADPH-dependent F420 reductase [Natronorarus salvus]|uniref:NADPH-dependent F420 reductase n=1 Tax=Natronorarus salvus TaxID=3117733 RepID=UPI002F263E34